MDVSGLRASSHTTPFLESRQQSAYGMAAGKRVGGRRIAIGSEEWAIVTESLAIMSKD